MTQPLILAANARVAKLINADRPTKLAVSELLSYQVEGVEFMSTSWSGRSSFFSMKDGTFPAGFFHLVHSALVKRGLKVMTKRSPIPEPLGPENPVVDAFGNDDPRYDYQLRALRAVERHGRGIIQVATGGGKSKICKLIAGRFRRMTLFVTTRGVLMYQMKEGFEEGGFKVGVIGDGIWAPTRGINVAMVQTLVQQLEETSLEKEAEAYMDRLHAAEKREVDKMKRGLQARKVPPARILKSVDELIAVQERRRPGVEEMEREIRAKFETKTLQRNRLIALLGMVEVVIGEEAHEVGGESYFRLLQHCKNAQVRVALTATPFMRADGESNMRLMAAFGGILIKVSEAELIEKGIFARPWFKFVTSAAHPKLYKTTPWQRAYPLGYVENEAMHADIVRDAKMAAARRMPVLTLILRKAHGEILASKMRAAGLRVEFIMGDDDQVARKAALIRLRDGEIDVLIGSTIVDVGVDVPAIGLVQLAGGGKAEIALRQRIGRGARAKKVGPNEFFVADYTTGPNATLKEHAAQRRAIIQDTDGFREGILKPGADFPWHHFDQERRAA